MPRGATAIGFTANLMWALLALFTVRTMLVSPLQSGAITFVIGGGGPDRLSLAALHIALSRPSAGRAADAAACRGRLP